MATQEEQNLLRQTFPRPNSSPQYLLKAGQKYSRGDRAASVLTTRLALE